MNRIEIFTTVEEGVIVLTPAIGYSWKYKCLYFSWLIFAINMTFYTNETNRKQAIPLGAGGSD